MRARPRPSTRRMRGAAPKPRLELTRRVHGAAWLLACCLGCAPTRPPCACPERELDPPPSRVDPVEARPDAIADQADGEHADLYDEIELEDWGWVEFGPDNPPTHRFDTVQITVSAFERPRPKEEEANGLWMRADLSGLPDASGETTVATRRFEAEVSTEACGAETSLDVQPIVTWSDVQLFDVRLRCDIGESLQRWSTAHMILRVDTMTGASSQLYFAEDGGVARPDEYVEASELTFHVEARTLGVYREHTNWCDEEAVYQAHLVHEADCKVGSRKLEFVERIDLGIEL